MSWIGREYVWFYDNWQGSEYASYNIYREVTQVNKYLLRDRCIQNAVEDLRWSAFEK